MGASNLSAPRLLEQFAFPGQGAGDNGIQVVIARLPAELAADAFGPRHQVGRIAGAARLFANIQGLTADILDHPQDFAHRIAVAVAHIERGRLAAAPQIGQALRCAAARSSMCR